MKININIWLRIPGTVIMYIRYADLKIFKLKKYRVITELLASISNKKSVSKATTTYFW